MRPTNSVYVLGRGTGQLCGVCFRGGGVDGGAWGAVAAADVALNVDRHDQSPGTHLPMAPMTRAARMEAAAGAARQGAEDAVPGPRADGPGDGWAALDHLSVWDCYLCHVPMAKDVNRLFHSDWALAFGEALDQVHHALEDPDPLALERTLKWALVCHQLLLRLDIAPSGTRGGQRYIATVKHRFTLLRQGGCCTLARRRRHRVG